MSNADKNAAKPSQSELAILKSLWSSGRQSAREIHDAISADLGWSYSSTRKTLDRMVEKGMLDTHDVHGIRVYAAGITKVATIAAMTRDFAARVLEINGALPVTAFTDSKLLSEDELNELQAMLDDSEDEGEAR
ncbi:BlaI/MecI/CopY family transcriptional regulator [Parvularcula flava]|uniref:BlaI/MecI/CopY family transcriptional regulator n=1 Tax=Aquisalinus luteolus TaxID=1566827 RepID=A0A8J3AA66_9PROT|nr:BlaI/MecI/CopY family transcriptional regulator [Aquisalinus luteolus]NHK29248.1 BlaI/MecI/CopY family transcriptional regulator [Aquisalinus luteolus]GGI01352.1 hypothetical protein GCM10011355_31790 [Aquisalinus luteolus]